MAERVEPFTVTCPANRPKTNALEVLTPLTPCRVELIEVKFPGGHAFLTGLGIAVAHQVVIPHTSSSWLIGDGETHHYPMHNYPESGAWSVFLFNTDKHNAHTWQIRYHVTDRIARRPRAIITPLNPADIYAAGRR